MTYIPPNPNGSATSANSSPVVIASDQSAVPVSGTVTANAGTNMSTAALALETGGNLAAIKTDVDKIPSQGQALAAASMPVVLTAAQVTALTPPTNTGYALDATLTGGSQQTKLTDGTTVVSNVVGDTGHNGVSVANGNLTIPFTTSSAGVQTLLPNTDVRGYAQITVYLTSVGVGLAWTGQWAPNSGGTYMSFSEWRSLAGTNTAGVTALTTTANNVSESAVHGNFFQLSVSALTSGTLSGYVILSTIPRPLSSLGVLAILGAGSSIIGKVGIDQTTVGTTNAVAIAQLGANTILTGNGVSGTGAQRVTIASDSTGQIALAAGSALVGKAGIDQTTPGTTNAVSIAQLGANTIASGNGTSSTGTLRVAIASDNTSNTNPFLVKPAITATSSGLVINKVLSAANTTPIQIKTSAGQLYGWHLFNTSASVRYIRFFNVASSPTMGTASPTFVIPLPAGGGAVLSPDNAGIPMATGIFYAVTTGAADLDNTAGAANDVVGTIWSI